MQNFTTLGQPLLGEKYVTQKKKRRKVIPKIVDTTSRAMPKGSARTPLGPIDEMGILCSVGLFVSHDFITNFP